MRLRNIKNSKEIIENSRYTVKNPFIYKGKWNKIFNNNNKIYIEIGMGKGNFILKNALKYKDVNFIGIEKYDTVIAKAVKNIDNYDIPNLRLVRIDAVELPDIFDNEIDLIYLNFSDPWPKERHEKRRLTNKKFLSIYDKIQKNNKSLILKTDNKKLFEYSIVSLSEFGYIIKNVNLDLHNSKECDIITTEYEDKFILISKPIYKLECEK